MNEFIVKKILNNNVVIAQSSNEPEVILIGKGIGFGKKRGEPISEEEFEKIFTLEDKSKQEQYKQLLIEIETDVFDAISEALDYIKAHTISLLNEHIHIAMTDHIAFAVKRWKQGVDIKNPFLHETQLLYPKEYEIAKTVTEILNKSLKIELPKDEIGFIALHIHSGISNRSLSEINKHSQLVSLIIKEVEKVLNIPLKENTVNYSRLVSHLHHVFERVERNEELLISKNLIEVLKKEYPLCYNLSCKIIKIIEQSFYKKVQDAEAVYITLHLQRLSNK